MRMEPKDRKSLILSKAIDLCEKPGGWSKITRKLLADHIGCAEALINRYYHSMANLKRIVMRTAIKERNLSIIAQGLACGDRQAESVSEITRKQALKHLIG